jgi:hypothetical protein
VTATNPQPHQDDGPRSGDIGRWLKWFALGLVALIVVVGIAVALTNLGDDDDPSGGDEQGLGPAVTLELLGAA